MVGCILTGHGSFAQGLGSAVAMIAGEQQDFEIVTFLEDEAATFPERLHKAVQDMQEKCGEVVVFCDLLGGTPFNQAMMVSAGIENVRVVTGTNLPILLECLPLRTDDMVAQDVVDMALSIGKMGIDSKQLELAEDDEDDLFEDGI